MKRLVLLLIVSLTSLLYSQTTDTLTFFSNAFNQNRTIYVQTSELYKYQSDSVQLPVIFILDGQHKNFIHSTTNNVKYLQKAYEIPQALIVIIPLENRVKECGIESLADAPLPLHTLITEEILNEIKAYHPNNYRILIGHSYSASFSLYSYLKSPGFYSAVLANTPLDHLEELVVALNKNSGIVKKNIFISIGGEDMAKDFYHRKKYNKLKQKYPGFFKKIHTVEADFSSHLAVPIVAIPQFLSELFTPFKHRFSNIAKTDIDYKLIQAPQNISKELALINKASFIDNYPYPPEISELNGLASSYISSGYNQYGLEIYKLGVALFPKYYEFHYYLGELYLEFDKEKARWHLDKAIDLLNTIDRDIEGRQEMITEIEELKAINGL